MTGLATSELDQHDEAYVEDNYSAELVVTALENGEKVSIEELSAVHLEDKEGEPVERTKEGYVPEYAVKNGQELTVRAEVDGETLEDRVTVSNDLPSSSSYNVIVELENGNEVSLRDLSKELGELRLENQEGERIETTEDGTVLKNAVEPGQELILRGTQEPLEVTVATVSEFERSVNFLVDAEIVENGETLYSTPWNTPYQFDSHTTDRQAFLDQRAQVRDEIAEENVIEKIDDDRIDEVWNGYVQENYDNEEEKKASALRMARAEVINNNLSGIHSSGKQAANEEKILRNLDFLPYDEVFIGGFTNPPEAEYDENGNRQIDGGKVPSKVAYVDDDWFHVGGINSTAKHINDRDEMQMVDATASSFSARSVLAEFEREMNEIDEDMTRYYTGEAVTSPVTLSSSMTYK